MSVYCPECGAANSPGSKKCRICSAKLPSEGKACDYGKFDFESEPKASKAVAPPAYLGLSITLSICCCCPLSILAIIFGLQSNYAFKNKDYDKADRKSNAARKTILWGVALTFVMWIVIFVSGILD